MNMDNLKQSLSSAEDIIAEAAAGRMFVLVDDEDRENEGDLVIPAQSCTASHINFMAKYGRGLICLAMATKGIDKLGLSLLPQSHSSRFGTAFTVSIEAREGVTTGISAADRAQTISVAANPECGAGDITTPGHVFPLAARDGGVLVRAGHTEAAVDISRLAGKWEAGVICEIMNDQGEMMRLPELVAFAKEHGLKIGTIADLIAYRLRHDHLLEKIAVETPTIDGQDFQLYLYRNNLDNGEHLVLVKGQINPDKPTLVRMQAKAVYQDFLMGLQGQSSLSKAFEQIKKADSAVMVLVGANPSAPPSLLGQIQPSAGDKADQGQPTNPPADLRHYGVGAQILKDIGVGKMILLSSHKRHIVGLEGYGLELVDWQSL